MHEHGSWLIEMSAIDRNSIHFAFLINEIAMPVYGIFKTKLRTLFE